MIPTIIQTGDAIREKGNNNGNPTIPNRINIIAKIISTSLRFLTTTSLTGTGSTPLLSSGSDFISSTNAQAYKNFS